MPNINNRIKNLAARGANDLKFWGGIEISERKMLEMILQSDSFAYFVEEVSYGGYETPKGGLDTCVRDVVFDVFANAAAGRNWPLNAESDSFADFYKTVCE